MRSVTSTGFAILGCVAGLTSWISTSDASPARSSGLQQYCIRLIGRSAIPVAAKDIESPTDAAARNAAAVFLNDHDKGLSPTSAEVAYPFVVIEGHPCDPLELKMSNELSSPRPHHRRRHHHKM